VALDGFAELAQAFNKFAHRNRRNRLVRSTGQCLPAKAELAHFRNRIENLTVQPGKLAGSRRLPPRFRTVLLMRRFVRAQHNMIGNLRPPPPDFDRGEFEVLQNIEIPFSHIIGES
jgi:hypothetical protein